MRGWNDGESALARVEKNDDETRSELKYEGLNEKSRRRSRLLYVEVERLREGLELEDESRSRRTRNSRGEMVQTLLLEIWKRCTFKSTGTTTKVSPTARSTRRKMRMPQILSPETLKARRKKTRKRRASPEKTTARLRRKSRSWNDSWSRKRGS